MNPGDAENMMQLQNMGGRLMHHPTKAQHTNALTLKQVNLEFQFTILMEVNMDPIIYFSIIYTTFLWMNFWQKFTPSSPMD